MHSSPNQGTEFQLHTRTNYHIMTQCNLLHHSNEPLITSFIHPPSSPLTNTSVNLPAVTTSKQHHNLLAHTLVTAQTSGRPHHPIQGLSQPQSPAKRLAVKPRLRCRGPSAGLPLGPDREYVNKPLWRVHTPHHHHACAVIETLRGHTSKAAAVGAKTSFFCGLCL